MAASGNQIYFFFIINIEKYNNRRAILISIKLHRQNHHSKHVFSWVSLNPQTTDPPTNRPPTTYPATHRLPTQWLTESIIIFGRLDNRNIFILQNTSTTGKTYNYTSVYYPKSLLVSIKHIQRSQLYSFF